MAAESATDAVSDRTVNGEGRKAERAPLLQHHREPGGQDPTSGTAQDDDDGHGPDRWAGEAYLAGLPWWRRPSVSMEERPCPSRAPGGRC